MAFISKTDYFSLASNNSLSVSDCSDGKTAQNVTALQEDGSVGACEVFGELLAPSNTYKVAGEVSATVVLGGVTTVDNHKIMLGNVSIGTTAGGEPTFTASGEEVEANAATNACTYSVEIAGLTPKRHAQILFHAFELGGSGCFLQDASYTIQANIGKATVNGEPVASDVTEGMIEANVTIMQTGASTPTVTTLTGDADYGWTITSPLACTNPDANYPTWSCTLTKYLQKDS